MTEKEMETQVRIAQKEAESWKHKYQNKESAELEQAAIEIDRLRGELSKAHVELKVLEAKRLEIHEKFNYVQELILDRVNRNNYE